MPGSNPVKSSEEFQMKVGITVFLIYMVMGWCTFGWAYHNDCKATNPERDFPIPCSLIVGAGWPIYVPLRLSTWAFDPNTKLPKLKVE
jgi:hypothetical protein